MTWTDPLQPRWFGSVDVDSVTATMTWGISRML